jgi:hypothetical protein
MRWAAVAAIVVVCPQLASAEKQHLVYGEVLGKAGLYGIGYEYKLTGRLSVGGAASFAVMSDQQVATFSPYVHGTILGGSRHRLFGEFGAVIAHSKLPSPVMGWEGMSDTGGGSFASLGWERASEHLVLRVSASMIIGEGGVAPMLGFVIGMPL